MATKKDDRETTDRPGDATAGPSKPAEDPTTHQAAAPPPADQGATFGAQRENAERSRKAVEQMAENVVEAGAGMTERSAAQAVEFGRRTTDHVRTLVASSTQIYPGLSEISKDDMDVLVHSTTRLAKGMQDVSWEVMQYTQQSLRIGMRYSNALMGCRSVEDMVEISQNFMRESVDTLLQESTKLLELSTHVATDSVGPWAESGHQTTMRH